MSSPLNVIPERGLSSNLSHDAKSFTVDFRVEKHEPFSTTGTTLGIVLYGNGSGLYVAGHPDALSHGAGRIG